MSNYSPTTWTNVTALTPAAMNKIENGIANIDSRMSSMQNQLLSNIIKSGYVHFSGTLNSGEHGNIITVEDSSVTTESIIVVNALTSHAVLATPAGQGNGTFNIYLCSVNENLYYSGTNGDVLGINYIIANPPTT